LLIERDREGGRAERKERKEGRKEGKKGRKEGKKMRAGWRGRRDRAGCQRV
jgi:hypothetical protein